MSEQNIPNFDRDEPWHVYEKNMNQLISSGAWNQIDGNGRESDLSVYLCLNIQISGASKLDRDELLIKVKTYLAEKQIKYNPKNLTIDAIANEGVNIGIEIDIRTIEYVSENPEISISKAMKSGDEYRSDLWNKNPQIDYRFGTTNTSRGR